MPVHVITCDFVNACVDLCYNLYGAGNVRASYIREAFLGSHLHADAAVRTRGDHPAPPTPLPLTPPTHHHAVRTSTPTECTRTPQHTCYHQHCAAVVIHLVYGHAVSLVGGAVGGGCLRACEMYTYEYTKGEGGTTSMRTKATVAWPLLTCA